MENLSDDIRNYIAWFLDDYNEIRVLLHRQPFNRLWLLRLVEHKRRNDIELCAVILQKLQNCYRRTHRYRLYKPKLISETFPIKLSHPFIQHLSFDYAPCRNNLLESGVGLTLFCQPQFQAYHESSHVRMILHINLKYWFECTADLSNLIMDKWPLWAIDMHDRVLNEQWQCYKKLLSETLVQEKNIRERIINVKKC